jgi:hypothetical protein
LSDIPITVNYFVSYQQLEALRWLIKENKKVASYKLIDLMENYLDKQLDPEVLRRIKNA